jgi:mono/diheme cytochrome c family protein
MRSSTIRLALALAPFAAGAFAQDVDNGRRLAERWCVECHAIDSSAARTSRVIPFAAIAKKPGINAEMIASFLLMPHAAMPNLPMSRKDVEEIPGSGSTPRFEKSQELK